MRQYRPSEIEGVWDEVEPLINRGLQYAANRWQSEDIKGCLCKGGLQLWYDGKNIGLTEVTIFPLSKTCRIFLGAGSNLNIFRTHLRVIEEWAREVGCADMEIEGRKGWARVLPDYKEKSVVIGKVL